MSRKAATVTEIKEKVQVRHRLVPPSDLAHGLL